MRYVKVCTNKQCKHKNDELLYVCERCDTNLGGVSAEPDVETAAPIPVTTHAGGKTTGTDAPTPRTKPAQHKPTEFQPEATVRRLHLIDPQNQACYTVQSGWILGRDNAAQEPHVALPSRDGVNYVHGQHCSFTCEDAQWFVSPIDQRPRRPSSNKTFVNAVHVPVGQRTAISDGDNLTVGDVTLVVRIVG